MFNKKLKRRIIELEGEVRYWKNQYEEWKSESEGWRKRYHELDAKYNNVMEMSTSIVNKVKDNFKITVGGKEIKTVPVSIKRKKPVVKKKK